MCLAGVIIRARQTRNLARGFNEVFASRVSRVINVLVSAQRRGRRFPFCLLATSASAAR